MKRQVSTVPRLKRANELFFTITCTLVINGRYITYRLIYKHLPETKMHDLFIMIPLYNNKT